MNARVRADSPWKIVTAFGGHEYVRGEWRSVPAGCEEEAGRHPYLETDDVQEQAAGQEAGPVDLVALSLDELRVMGKAARLPFAATMKRETLIAKLSARSDE